MATWTPAYWCHRLAAGARLYWYPANLREPGCLSMVPSSLPQDLSRRNVLLLALQSRYWSDQPLCLWARDPQRTTTSNNSNTKKTSYRKIEKRYMTTLVQTNTVIFPNTRYDSGSYTTICSRHTTRLWDIQQVEKKMVRDRALTLIILFFVGLGAFCMAQVNFHIIAFVVPGILGTRPYVSLILSCITFPFFVIYFVFWFISGFWGSLGLILCLA